MIEDSWCIINRLMHSNLLTEKNKNVQLYRLEKIMLLMKNRILLLFFLFDINCN